MKFERKFPLARGGLFWKIRPPLLKKMDPLPWAFGARPHSCALVAEVPGHRQGQVTQSLIVCMSKTLFKHTNSWKCPALSCYPPCMKVTANLISVGSDLLSRKNKDWMLPFILPDVFLRIRWTQMCIVTPCPRLAGIRSLWYAVMW